MLVFPCCLKDPARPASNAWEELRAVGSLVYSPENERCQLVPHETIQSYWTTCHTRHLFTISPTSLSSFCPEGYMRHWGCPGGFAGSFDGKCGQEGPNGIIYGTVS